MNSEHYFLPASYSENPVISLDQNENVYWDQQCVNNSLAYQAALYDLAMLLINWHDIKSVVDVCCVRVEI